MVVTPTYAFIPGPLFTTLSGGMFVLHFEIFLIPFLLSILFQGWFIRLRHPQIPFVDSAIQSFIAKILFILYAFPLLILADALGFLSLWLLDKIPFLEYTNETFVVILNASFYFILGVALFVSVVSQIESYFFTKKWTDVNAYTLRRTVRIVNSIIFLIAFIIVILSKEYL
jgi:hypothetical protein